MKKIKMQFLNDDLESMIKQYRVFLGKEHIFYYNESTIIRDLFQWIIIKLDSYDTFYNDERLREQINICLNGRTIKMRLEYNLNDFIKKNNIKNLYLYFMTGIGGGAGAYIPILGTIRINPNESKHKNIPHVHVNKNGKHSYDDCVRINLNDLSQMKGDKKSVDELFKKKQKNVLYDFLENNRQKLIDYYNNVQNGEYVDPIYIKYNGKIVQFK